MAKPLFWLQIGFHTRTVTVPCFDRVWKTAHWSLGGERKGRLGGGPQLKWIRKAEQRWVANHYSKMAARAARTGGAGREACEDVADAASVVPRRMSLRQDERDWIAQQRDKATEVQTMQPVYRSRIDELQAMANDARAVQVETDAATLRQACRDYPEFCA